MLLPPNAIGSCWTSNVLTKSQITKSTISMALALRYCGMATFCAWRRMDQLTFYFVWAHPPPFPPSPPREKTPRETAWVLFQPTPGMDWRKFFLWHHAHCPRPSQLETTFNWLLFGWPTMMSHTWISQSISALDLNGHPLVVVTSKNLK